MSKHKQYASLKDQVKHNNWIPIFLFIVSFAFAIGIASNQIKTLFEHDTYRGIQIQELDNRVRDLELSGEQYKVLLNLKIEKVDNVKGVSTNSATFKKEVK